MVLHDTLVTSVRDVTLRIYMKAMAKPMPNRDKAIMSEFNNNKNDRPLESFAKKNDILLRLDAIVSFIFSLFLLSSVLCKTS